MYFTLKGNNWMHINKNKLKVSSAVELAGEVKYIQINSKQISEGDKFYYY